MKTVHKYEVSIESINSDGSFVYATHMQAEPLSVKEQNGKLCLWCKVDTDQPKQNRTLYIGTTGNPLPEVITPTRYSYPNYRFLDTVLMLNGNMIVHVWTDEVLFNDS